ncbi:MAG: hypothetical protein JSV20_02155 [Candidatus Bathyarchaeota archaeon]|nr:MAG: hypothetical protein JSV20_02155 [Candidatus Bathyarchaeota archaeon]
MLKKSIVYFPKKGAINTEETINLAYERAVELGIKDIVVASTHGNTALQVAKIFTNPSFNLIAVSISEAFEEEGWIMTKKEKTHLQKKGIRVFTGLHALGDDVNAAFTEKFGGKAINEVVTQTLYRFCQGMKVCVEIVLMVADAGLISIDKEVIAIAGTNEGADTAIVVKPSYPRTFLDLKVTEIIAKPREG